MKDGYISIKPLHQRKIRGFEEVEAEFKKSKAETKLPTGGSKHSAGYDFYSKETVTIQPNESHCFWTDVKAYMQLGEWLAIFVRSSIGIKKSLRLKNSVGVIDGDYYSNPDNDGNIGIALHNFSTEPVTIEVGERIAQGVFMNYLASDNGNTDSDRNGGIGSTGTK